MSKAARIEVSEIQRRIDELRSELRALLRASERNTRRIDELMGELATLQEEQYGR